jgi:hypothetical protein
MRYVVSWNESSDRIFLTECGSRKNWEAIKARYDEEGIQYLVILLSEMNDEKRAMVREMSRNPYLWRHREGEVEPRPRATVELVFGSPVVGQDFTVQVSYSSEAPPIPSISVNGVRVESQDGLFVFNEPMTTVLHVEPDAPNHVRNEIYLEVRNP